jgi:hypothetical protein
MTEVNEEVTEEKAAETRDSTFIHIYSFDAYDIIQVEAIPEMLFKRMWLMSQGPDGNPVPVPIIVPFDLLLAHDQKYDIQNWNVKHTIDSRELVDKLKQASDPTVIDSARIVRPSTNDVLSVTGSDQKPWNP